MTKKLKLIYWIPVLFLFAFLSYSAKAADSDNSVSTIASHPGLKELENLSPDSFKNIHLLHVACKDCDNCQYCTEYCGSDQDCNTVCKGQNPPEDCKYCSNCSECHHCKEPKGICCWFCHSKYCY